jgi:EmrB/QacA subfamily drug resistance transporter
MAGSPAASTRGTDRSLIAVAVLSSFVAFLDGSVVNLALPAIGREFAGGLTLQEWVVDGYLLALGALILVAGAISDAFGRLSVLRMGLVIFALSSLMCALAPNGGLLIAARCVQGVGAAFLVPSSLAMLNARFTGTEQARAVGIWTAWTGTAFVIGPVLGGVLVDVLNWRWIFAVNILPIAVTLLLTRNLAHATAESRTTRPEIDVPGAVLAAIGLTGTVFALIEQQRLGFSAPLVSASLLVGIVCLAVFPWWERRAVHPMMPLHIFARRNFAVGNLATVFLYAGVSLGTLIIALFLQETAGMSAALAGVATLPIPLLSFFLARRFGDLAGRYGPRLFMGVGPLVAAAGYLLMATACDDFNFWLQMLPGLVFFGLGLSITVSPLTSAILAAVDPAQSGIGSAINNAIARISGLIAIAFTSLVISGGQRGSGKISGAVDFAGFRQAMFVVAGLLALAGAISAVWIRNDNHGVAGVPPVVLANSHDRATPPPAIVKR